MRPWMHTLVDFMLDNPELPLKETAAHFRRSYAYMSMIMNSDMFKSELARRREERRRATDEGITHRLGKIATKALDVLEEKLDNTAKLSTGQVKDIADMTLNRLGYGVVKEAPPMGGTNNSLSVTVNLPQEVLTGAREAIRQREQGLAQTAVKMRGPDLIEGTVAQSGESPGAGSGGSDAG